MVDTREFGDKASMEGIHMPKSTGVRYTEEFKAEAVQLARSYVTNLRKGHIESPGYEKRAAMAKAMGVPAEVWFGQDLDDGRCIEHGGSARKVAGRLEHLF